MYVFISEQHQPLASISSHISNIRVWNHRVDSFFFSVHLLILESALVGVNVSHYSPTTIFPHPHPAPPSTHSIPPNNVFQPDFVARKRRSTNANTISCEPQDDIFFGYFSFHFFLPSKLCDKFSDSCETRAKNRRKCSKLINTRVDVFEGLSHLNGKLPSLATTLLMWRDRTPRVRNLTAVTWLYLFGFVLEDGGFRDRGSSSLVTMEGWHVGCTFPLKVYGFILLHLSGARLPFPRVTCTRLLFLLVDFQVVALPD